MRSCPAMIVGEDEDDVAGFRAGDFVDHDFTRHGHNGVQKRCGEQDGKGDDAIHGWKEGLDGLKRSETTIQSCRD